ncbi:MAG: hypothetical protein JSV18_03865 [Candidatus Bathyarchaeota archaeon]|nr:MAG: hypothetical protein JSV18_03865 [Candidatus Bathyarchaeota archaeon]
MDRRSMGLNLITRDAQFEDKQLHAAVAELGNAVIALFWEGEEPRLGTLTVTLPDRSSASLLGDRDRQLGLILGAQITAMTGKMSLVSTNLPQSLGDAAGRPLLLLARDIIGGRGILDE